MGRGAGIEDLINLFEVRVDAFALCEVAKNASLLCDPFDKTIVHFVLRGTGRLEFSNGKRSLRPKSVLIVPPGISKTISGEGPIDIVCDANEHCPLENGLLHFKAGTGRDLTIVCAAVTATIGGVLDVFKHLWEPIADHAAGTTVAPLFAMIEKELSTPQVGATAMVGALMKQVLIGVFRSQLAQEPYRAWLWPAMMHPQLGRAALAVMSRPQDQHRLESLADLAGMSRAQFAAQFTKTFGRSPMDFVQAVRLKLAQRLLISSSLPVKTVAAAVGYSSRSHFSRSFHARYGYDPSTFRKRALAPIS